MRTISVNKWASKPSALSVFLSLFHLRSVSGKSARTSRRLSVGKFLELLFAVRRQAVRIDEARAAKSRLSLKAAYFQPPPLVWV